MLFVDHPISLFQKLLMPRVTNNMVIAKLVKTIDVNALHCTEHSTSLTVHRQQARFPTHVWATHIWVIYGKMTHMGKWMLVEFLPKYVSVSRVTLSREN